jgi:riboflavin synthase
VFTGLVQEIGTIRQLEQGPDGVRLTVAAELARELSEGDSVALCGVCLTAIAPSGSEFQADVMHETLRRSSLDTVLSVGGVVNLELALRVGARLGGHIVQGHVDGVGTVSGSRDDGFARVLSIAAPPELLRYVVEKGSIAVDGVSLTVAAVDGSGFDISLIPETLERTTLGGARIGHKLNLEVDVLAKYVEKLVAGR